MKFWFYKRRGITLGQEIIVIFRTSDDDMGELPLHCYVTLDSLNFDVWKMGHLLVPIASELLRAFELLVTISRLYFVQCVKHLSSIKYKFFS
jgi:hypothetical protein